MCEHCQRPHHSACTFFMCALRQVLFFSTIPHWPHISACGDAWAFLWSLSCTFQAAAYGHWSHLKGFSPLCVRRCDVSWYSWVNDWPQVSHLWGFTPADKAKYLNSMNEKFCPLLITMSPTVNHRVWRYNHRRRTVIEGPVHHAIY